MKNSVAVNLLSQMFLAQFSEEEHEALGMAIDALNTLAAQPEIIRCEDCKYLQEWRSEEAARKFGQAYTCEKNIFYCPKPEDFCSRAKRKTNAQPKTGEWIIMPMLPDNHRYKCSICNCHHGTKYNYCPSCGAVMRVEE